MGTVELNRETGAGVVASAQDNDTLSVLILYFSATGNTEYAARYLAAKLHARGLRTTLASIERQPPEELDPFDVLIVGFPVYSCDSPRIFERYLRGIPRGQGRAAFSFCTKGAFAGNAPRRTLRVLADAGYAPSGSAVLGMPGTDGLPFMASDSWAVGVALRKDYDHLPSLDTLAVQVECTILAGGAPARGRLPMSLSGLLFDPLWAYVYEVFGRRFRARLRADESCRACGLCARVCPTGSLQIVDGHPSFGEGCELCMRCVHACPESAVQIGKGTVGKFRWSGPRGDFDALTTHGGHKRGVR